LAVGHDRLTAALMVYRPVPPDGSRDAARRKAAWGRTWTALLMIVGDLTLAMLAGSAWRTIGRIDLPDVSGAYFLLWGVTAVAGVPILALLAVANHPATRAGAARRLASIGQVLAGVRLGGLAVAVAVASGVRGEPAEVGIVVLAGIDCLAAVLLGWRTSRNLRHPPVP
jgi:hypothetical protein